MRHGIVLAFVFLAYGSAAYSQSAIDARPISAAEMEEFERKSEEHLVDVTDTQRALLIKAFDKVELPNDLLESLNARDAKIPELLVRSRLSDLDVSEAFVTHKDPIVRFNADYALAKAGRDRAAERIHMLLRDPSVSSWEARVLKTPALFCGLDPKNDTPETIRAHLESLKREFPLLKVGAAVPNLEFLDVDGKAFNLESLKDRFVILHFWATWCGPCMAEMDKLGETLKELPDAKVCKIFVCLDFDREAFDKQIPSIPIDCRHVFDGLSVRGNVPKVFGVNRIPINVVIGRDGKIASYNLKDMPALLKRDSQ